MRWRTNWCFWRQDFRFDLLLDFLLDYRLLIGCQNSGSLLFLDYGHWRADRDGLWWWHRFDLLHFQYVRLGGWRRGPAHFKRGRRRTYERYSRCNWRYLDLQIPQIFAANLIHYMRLDIGENFKSFRKIKVPTYGFHLIDRSFVYKIGKQKKLHTQIYSEIIIDKSG